VSYGKGFYGGGQGQKSIRVGLFKMGDEVLF